MIDKRSKRKFAHETGAIWEDKQNYGSKIANPLLGLNSGVQLPERRASISVVTCFKLRLCRIFLSTRISKDTSILRIFEAIICTMKTDKIALRIQGTHNVVRL